MISGGGAGGAFSASPTAEGGPEAQPVRRSQLLLREAVAGRAYVCVILCKKTSDEHISMSE